MARALTNEQRSSLDQCFAKPGESRYLEGIYKPYFPEMKKAQALVPVAGFLKINHANIDEVTKTGVHKLLRFDSEKKGGVVFGGEMNYISTTSENEKTDASKEDHGYVVHLIYDNAMAALPNTRDRQPNCECRLYDAKTMEEVGRWKLPEGYRVAMGAHTIWIPGEEL